MHSQNNQHGNRARTRFRKLPTTIDIVAMKFRFDSKQTARQQLQRTSKRADELVQFVSNGVLRFQLFAINHDFMVAGVPYSPQWTGDRNQLNQKRQCKQCNFNKINDYTALHSRARTHTPRHTHTHSKSAISISLSLTLALPSLLPLRQMHLYAELDLNLIVIVNLCSTRCDDFCERKRATAAVESAEKEQEKCQQISKHKQDDDDKKECQQQQQQWQQHSN